PLRSQPGAQQSERDHRHEEGHGEEHDYEDAPRYRSPHSSSGRARQRGGGSLRRDARLADVPRAGAQRAIGNTKGDATAPPLPRSIRRITVYWLSCPMATPISTGVWSGQYDGGQRGPAQSGSWVSPYQPTTP